MPDKKKKHIEAKVIDLFCGIGGISHGFILEGFDVVAGIDSDPSCKYGYEKNNGSKFINKDISNITSLEIKELFSGNNHKRILIGCAPCQAFSDLNPQRKGCEKNIPLRKFSNLIEEVLPDIVSMENVKGLTNRKKFPVFNQFLRTLKECRYNIFYDIIDCSDYGVPQTRKRLVLLASLLGPITMITKTHDDSNKVTVRDAIGHLEPIEDGEISAKDRLHRANKLNEINKRRIKTTPHDGGSSDNWSDDLRLKCHKKKSGRSYRHSVYGRMKWDEPGSTMTTLCTGLGNGRFGHPEQDRAISLREAALLQTFPEYYEFMDPNEIIIKKKVSRFIGNAVPVRVAQAIAKSISNHLEKSNA